MRSRTVREGSLGLFILLGVVISGGIALWLGSGGFGRNSYKIVAQFPDAGGVQVGGAVRYRGVQVGRITDIKAGSNGVDVTIEISPGDLRMPSEIKIETNRSGLLGESSIEITPLKSLSQEAFSLNPRGSDCNPKLIICNNAVLQGSIGIDPIRTLARLSEIYSDPKFYENFNNSITKIGKASEQITILAKQLSNVAKAAEDDLEVFRETAQSITKAVNQTSSQITKTTEQLNVTASSINTLATNANQLVVDNRANVTKNLRNISDTFSQPGNLSNLQQILDSARATFANTQKITADLDELTGDPAFRNNVRKLINGLGRLVSLKDQLEQQVKTVQALELLTQQLKK